MNKSNIKEEWCTFPKKKVKKIDIADSDLKTHIMQALALWYTQGDRRFEVLPTEEIMEFVDKYYSSNIDVNDPDLGV